MYDTYINIYIYTYIYIYIYIYIYVCVYIYIYIYICIIYLYLCIYAYIYLLPMLCADSVFLAQRHSWPRSPPPCFLWLQMLQALHVLRLRVWPHPAQRGAGAAAGAHRQAHGTRHAAVRKGGGQRRRGGRKLASLDRSRGVRAREEGWGVCMEGSRRVEGWRGDAFGTRRPQITDGAAATRSHGETFRRRRRRSARRRARGRLSRRAIWPRPGAGAHSHSTASCGPLPSFFVLMFFFASACSCSNLLNVVYVSGV